MKGREAIYEQELVSNCDSADGGKVATPAMKGDVSDDNGYEGYWAWGIEGDQAWGYCSIWLDHEVEVKVLNKWGCLGEVCASPK